MNRNIVGKALWQALATAVYVALVANVMFYAGQIFPHAEPTVLVPMAMLSLLVFSAALCGSLIFARPVLWYLDGRKREALLLLSYTLIFFFLLTAIILGALYLLMQ